MPNMIKIWPWIYAPKKFKKLSTLGGDENWIAYIPGEYKHLIDADPWITSIDTAYTPQEVQLDNGDWIYIGGHA